MTDWNIAMAILYMQMTDKDLNELEEEWLGEYNGKRE